jgi:hypothetical protein
MNLPARVLRSVCRRVALVSMPFVAWSAESRPNILLAIADDWSREHAGAYGCTWVRTYLGADPRCLKNLASDPALQEVKRGLRSELEATLRREEDPRVLGNAAIFDGPSYRYRAPVQYTYDAWLRFQSAAP